MLTLDFLVAHANTNNKGQVDLSVKDKSKRFKILGHSEKNATVGLDIYIHSCSVEISPVKLENVGVMIIKETGFSATESTCVVAVDRKNGKILLNHDNEPEYHFHSPSGKLLQLHSGYFEVHCRRRGITYTIYTTNKKDDGKEGYKYIPDGNILCQFLVGDITEKKMIAKIEEMVGVVNWKDEYNVQVEAYTKLLTRFQKEQEKLADVENILSNFIERCKKWKIKLPFLVPKVVKNAWARLKKV